MKQFLIGLSLAALAAGGVAYAQQGMHPMADADSDGVVTRAEAQAHAAKAFAFMDANNDGKIDQADRDAMHAKHMTMMFDAMDADKNGQISRDEFNAAHAPGKGPGMGMPGMGHRGGMKHEGMGGHGMHGGMGKMGMRHGGRMMAMADADKNGSVSQAEFTSAALARFDTADANKDGKVTGDERRAAHEKMREQWRARMQDGAKSAPAS